MKVAWLAPFNLRSLAHRLPLAGQYHPAPWITNGARALVARGDVELHLVTFDTVDKDYEFQERGIWFHILRARIPVIPRALSLFKLDLPIFHEALRRIDPDVVHGHGTENVFSYAAVLSGRPNVVSMQAVMAELVKTQAWFSRVRVHQTILRMIESWTLKKASRVLVEAPFVADILRRVNPSIEPTVVGNIVSQPFFDIASRPGPRGNRVVFVGSLLATKGVPEAILAFQRLAREWPDLELHIAGTGTPAYVRRLKAMAGAGAGADRIVFRGILTADEIAEQYPSGGGDGCRAHSLRHQPECRVRSHGRWCAGRRRRRWRAALHARCGRGGTAGAAARSGRAGGGHVTQPARAGSGRRGRGSRAETGASPVSPQTFVSTVMTTYRDACRMPGRASA